MISVPEYGANPASKFDVVQVGSESESESGEFKGQVTPEVAPEVTPEVKRLIFVIEGEMTRKELQRKLGLKDEKYFRESYQQAGVAAGLIEMTIPDKPKSRLQKYRLTAKGQLFLTRMQEDKKK